MAETYLTPTFQNATKPQAPPPTGANPPAQNAPAPPQTGGEQYQTDTFKKAVAPQQTTTQPTTSANQPDSGWGIDWNNPWYKGGPALKAPQSVQDFGDIAGNEAMAQNPANYAAARQRLGPIAAGGADLVGNVLSPTTLLNAVPGVGPELAGATHEGLKSFASGNDWKTIGEDTLGGAGWGAVGHGAAKLAPAVLPQLTEWGLKAGPIGYGTKLMHDYLGNVGADVATGVGLFGLVDKASRWAGEQAGKVASSPTTQQAIRSVILGAGSQARQNAGPYDQWIPGQ